MYPRNAASPPPIAIGQVVQISDGAVQTTGASVRVSTGTGAYGAGSGTLACDTTSGIWSYTPTQAETNDTVIRIAVYKASCLGCAATVVTSASATAGKVVLSAETHTSAVIPTVTTLTNAPSDSTGVTTLLSRIVGTLATGTHQPQTGDAYALAANGTYGLSALKALLDIIAAYIDTEVTAIKAKTDNLPATPASTSDIPSAVANASAVRTELATELGRLDAAVSTRLATAGYTAPLSASGVRDAVGLAAANLDTQLAALDALLDSILDDTGTAGVVLSAAMMNKIADHVRRRTQANTEASSDGDTLSLASLYGLIQQAQESSVSGGILTVKKTDGSTTLGTKIITSSASADPITGIE